MLIKLMKHEFLATSRIMGPVFLVLLATSAAANVSLRVLLESEYDMLNLLGGLLLMAFIFSIVAVCIAAVILMVYRFYKNLLQDEGYVMLTLPVSIHQHIWTKLLVSAVWFALTMLAVFLACMIAFVNIEELAEFFQALGEMFRDMLHLDATDIANLTALGVELLVLCFISCCDSCLRFYASLAIGHGASSHKLAWSVAAYMIIAFIIQWVSGLGMLFLNWIDIWNLIPDAHMGMGMYGNAHLLMVVLLLGEAVYGVVFYLITVISMKRRLNLE